MKKNFFSILIAAMMLASCVEDTPMDLPHVDENLVSFSVDDMTVTVQTKATEVTATTLSSSGFRVSATTGAAGSEAAVWTNIAFAKSGTTWTGNKYWPASNPSYHFYASNATLTHTAAGATVAATSATDVVCAYMPSPTYKVANALTFEHIFARIGNVVVTQVPGYTISGISLYVTPKTGGTYNIRTGAGHSDGTGWSGLTTGSSTRIANAGGTNSNDLYLVPGDYELTCSWTSTDVGGNSVTHTNVRGMVPIVGGKVNIINVALGGDVMFGIDVNEFEPYAWGEDLEPLTFEAIESGSILWKTSDASFVRTIEYSKDNGNTWTELVSTTAGAAISVSAGDKVLIRGNNAAYSDGTNYCSFGGTSRYYVYGNITSLLMPGFRNYLQGYVFYYLFKGNNYLNSHPNKKILLPSKSLALYCYAYMFQGCTSMTAAPALPATMLANYCYQYMFQNCSSLTAAPALPAATLTNYCYAYMFQGCTSMTAAPVLPATTLANYCYCQMFQGCSSLTAAPVLPATTLANYCYAYMFQGCSSLTAAPALPAETLMSYCYNHMFQNCISLTAAPALPATTLAISCYSNMFQGCSSLTAAPALPATTLASSCYSNMFQNCISLTAAPALPATTLMNNCYGYMFYGCTSLTAAPALPATTLAGTCYGNMFQNCTSLTAAPNLPATTLYPYSYYGMFQGCTSLTTAPTISATKLNQNCCSNMFYGCTSLTTAPALPATTLAYSCYSQMFYGCTSLTTAPVLPATDLTSGGNCYGYMFYGCTSLNYIKALFTTTPTGSYTQSWVANVAASGTFVKNSAATWNVTGVNGVPTGWTVQTVTP